MKSGKPARSSARLRAGDAVGLERPNGGWMKGVVVRAVAEGVDVVVDGPILEGEVLSVSRTVRDDARYTAVMEVVDAGPGRSRVRLVGDWKRVQMREFVRVAVLGVRLSVETEADSEAPDGPAPAPERLVDLSAGGLRFESMARYAQGDLLEIEFSLPQTGPVCVRGEVIRVAGRRNEDAGPRQYGVRSFGVDEATRVKIMTWVFAEQARRFRLAKKPAIATKT